MRLSLSTLPGRVQQDRTSRDMAWSLSSVSGLGLSSGSRGGIHRVWLHRMRALGKSARASAPLVQLELQRARSIKRVLAAVGS